MRAPWDPRMSNEIDRRWFVAAVLLLHAALVLIGYHPHTFIRGDGVAYAYMDVSLAEDGDLYLENNLPFPPGGRPESSLYALGRDGRLWPKHPPLLPLAAFPFYLALGLNGLLVFNVLLLGGTVLLLSLLLPRRIPLPKGLAFASVFLLPYVFFHTYSFSPDLLLAFLAALMLWGLQSGKEEWAGLASGLMVFLRPNYLFQVVLGAALARKRAPFLLGAGVGLLPCLAYNAFAFGAPWLTGYHRVVVATAAGPRLVSHTDLFSLDPSRFLQLFAHWDRGLLFSAPVVFPLLLALALRWRSNRRPAAFVFATWGWHLLFYTCYVPWLADHVGIRFLMPPVLLSALGALGIGAPAPREIESVKTEVRP